ncbi:hypothetical protein [Allomuricauda sp. M10]|uniref:hypothetical protein n=1 Tax=Allomuricauda sp. M10 TaxID=2683292 RepID=UPI001D185FC5|nr:hypothetical protein [Muricauda sp. M10]
MDYNYQELRNVQQELDSLLELKDRNYPKIKQLERKIEFYSKSLEEFPDGETVILANQYKEELEKLKKGKFPSTKEESQIIDDALYSLVKNEINGFTLYLDLEMGTSIDFVKLGESQIQLSIKVEDEDDAKRIKKILLSDISNLTYNANSNSLVKTFAIQNNPNLLPIKETVSRIVIISKGFLRAENTIYLKRIPKN